MTLDPEALDQLATLLQRHDPALSVTEVTQLSGGASRQTFDIRTAGGAGQYVLQRELSEEPRFPGGMADEGALVAAARNAGVPTPVVVATNRDGGPAIGPSFLVTEAVPGETIARKLLRDDRYVGARAALPGQLGRALAALHTSLDPAAVPWLEATDQLARYREVADELDLVSPAFELAFRWLVANQPPAEQVTVVHGDFRLGNLIVDDAGLAAVIDWELGHLGDPMEDLGWLCVRAWRFGGPGVVAGIGDLPPFLAAYEAAAGRPVDRAAVRWWQTLGTLKWGIMCGTQADRHLSGLVPSVELVSIGPRVAEQEYDVLRLIASDTCAAVHPDPLSLVGDPGGTGAAEGGGRPSPVDLIAAVGDFVRDDVGAATEGRTRFHARVAANALAIVARDLAAAPVLASRRAARLAGLGFDSERALAAAIRSGTLDRRTAEVTAVVYESVLDRLAVNNPGWIED
ncbi:MAG: phosphotransferase family protein [Actinomycetota bacterium]